MFFDLSKGRFGQILWFGVAAEEVRGNPIDLLVRTLGGKDRGNQKFIGVAVPERDTDLRKALG